MNNATDTNYFTTFLQTTDVALVFCTSAVCKNVIK